MRVHELLLESSAPEHFEDFIHNNCGEFMAALDADIEVIESPRFSLYRGIKEGSLPPVTRMILRDGRPVDAYIKTVRSDREPKDTPNQISEMIDDILEEKFGWRPRKQGMFCFPFKNRGGTDDYGERYRVYPMGPLEFVYSPKVRDLTYELSRYMAATGTWPKHGQRLGPDNMEAARYDVRAFINDRGYTNKDMHAAMISEGKPEIMVRCDKYLAITASRHEW